MVERDQIISAVKDYLRQAHAQHDDPNFVVKWRPDGLPTVNRCDVHAVINNDLALLEVFDEAIARGAGRSVIDWFREDAE